MSRARRLRAAASLAVAGGLLVVVLPKVVGTGARAVLEQLAALTAAQLAALVALWLAGLWAHTFVSTAALPRLSHRQALTLNLAGSAVANSAPFGGALGMGLNLAMVRSWGLDVKGFAPFTALTALWNVLVKLALPVLACGLLLAAGSLAPHVAVAAAVCAGVLTAVLALLAMALVSPRAGAALGRLVHSAVQPLARRVPRLAYVRVDVAFADVWRRSTGLLARGWRRMLVSMAAYVLLQAILLWLVLNMLGSELGPVQVFAGFAVGRALTLLVFTPGGVGLSETGTAALLVGLGGDPATVAAGVLLFSALTFALEIPVGGACALVWWQRQRRCL